MKKLCFALIAIVIMLIGTVPVQADDSEPNFVPAPFRPIPIDPVIIPPAPPPSNTCTVMDQGIAIDDTDCDGVADKYDNCDTVLNCDQLDWDENGIGDACQDLDGDNIPDATYIQDKTINTLAVCDSDTLITDIDNCPMRFNPGQEDEDDDGVGDLCDDDDEDGFIDINDNCPDIANTTQVDRDEDGLGDACDNCPIDYNPEQEDFDDDGVGDVCGPDADSDGIPDSMDNCVYVRNADQADDDEDEVGNVCDNCPDDENTDQIDSDDNGIGDACEPETGYETNDPVAQPAPSENPQFEVGEQISGSGGFTSGGCYLSAHAAASAEGLTGIFLIAAGLVPLVIRRRK